VGKRRKALIGEQRVAECRSLYRPTYVSPGTHSRSARAALDMVSSHSMTIKGMGYTIASTHTYIPQRNDISITLHYIANNPTLI
jgi:hypothetical protein